MKLSELREHTREGRWSEPGLMRWRLDIGSLQELVADIDRELIDLEVAVRREERDAKQELGWGAPATEERQALTARLRAQEEFAQTLRRVLDEAREAIRIGVASDNDQDKRIATLENALGANVARVRDIERGVTSPAQLVPDMLKRIEALEAFVHAPR